MGIKEELIETLSRLDKAIATIDLAKAINRDPRSIRRYLDMLRAEGIATKKIERRPRLAFDGAMVGRQKVAYWRLNA